MKLPEMINQKQVQQIGEREGIDDGGEHNRASVGRRRNISSACC